VKIVAWAGAIVAIALVAQLAAAQTTPNPAMNAPDQLAWAMFLQVSADASTREGNDALFETWPNDGDTFVVKPARFARMHHPLRLSPQTLVAAHDPSLEGAGEETNRNQEAYDFIIDNHLYSVRGLQAAFGTTLRFPVDAVEVKTNWYPVERIPGYAGDPSKAHLIYHVSKDADGRAYALVSMHIISKAVPNWTWATFEHENSPARCDILGCSDTFGAQAPYVVPNAARHAGYGACPHTAALRAMFVGAKLDAAFAHYCLKGTQSDFTDTTGIAVRLGNSVTENGFVAQSSCMTCHARAAFSRDGRMTSFGGFDTSGNSFIGVVNPAWFWSNDRSTQIATQADFVWSIPFCAVDDTVANPKPSALCGGK
jgi:hypothetical protein